MRQRVAILLPLMLAVLTACGQSLETGTRPTRQALTQFRVPVEQMTLDNGLRVVVSADRDLDRVHVGGWYGAGLRSPTLAPTVRGLVAARMLVLPDDARPPVVESDLTGFVAAASPSDLPDLLEREAQRMALTGDFDAERFHQARRQVTDNPGNPVPSISTTSLRWSRLLELAGMKPASTAAESLADLRPEDMRTWLADWYSPANATVVVVGPVSASETFSLVGELFGGFTTRERQGSGDTSHELPDQLREERHIGDPGDATGAVTLAYRMPERHTNAWYAMGLLATVVRNDLAETDSELRVDTGLNLLGEPFSGRAPAFWYVRVQSSPATATTTLIERIQQTIERLRTRPISHTRLQSAIESARRTFYPLNAGLGPAGRMKLLAAFTLLDDDPDRINQLDRRFRSVTPQSILGAAQRYLRPTNCTILTTEPQREAAAGAENRTPIR